MKNVGHLKSYQQKLLSVLAILDEAEVIGVFRALRHAPHRNEVIDLVNEELDKGRSLIEMRASGPLYTLFTNNHLQMCDSILGNGRISIDIGTGGEECGMGTWTFAVDGAGQVHDGHPFHTSIHLS